MEHETIDVIWVLPPTVYWIIDLDKDAEIGMQEKKLPTRSDIPLKKIKNLHSWH